MPTSPSPHHQHPHHQRPFGMAIAIDHCHDLKPPLRTRHCRLRSFAQPDTPCNPDQDRATAPGLSPKHRSLSSPCFSTIASAANPNESLDKKMARMEIIAGRHARGVHTLIVEAAVAIALGTRLGPVLNGLGGALLLNSRSGKHLAVIKPVDEEPPPSLGNLRGPVSRHSTNASKVGVREVAAFLLDHGGFSGVAPTALIRISHSGMTTTMASIQRFVPHDFDAGELGPSRFSVASVHRIGVLDIRLLNIDRHAGNILVKKQNMEFMDSYNGNTSTSLELVPIDHGLCLPEQLDDPYFEWLHWPQSSLPFSDTELQYISSLDPFEDAELLRTELPSLKEPAIRILILCTIFLKRAAAAGLCLADIGDMMTQEFSAHKEGLSALEILCKHAEDSIDASVLPLSSDYDDLDEESAGDEARETQFEMDCGEEELSEDVGVPFLLQSTNRDDNTLVTLREEDGEGECSNKEDAKVGSIAKSVSFSVAELNYEGGSGKHISFKGLSDEEWTEFLERFEQLLPDAFEAKKCTGLKLRLGTSCKF